MYVDESTYISITGKEPEAFLNSRSKRASRLLDVRLGNRKRLDKSDNDYDGYKVDLDAVKTYQKEAVQEWVSWMIYTLWENNDSVEINESIKLGRFSVTKRDGKSEMIPDALVYADQMIKDSGLVQFGLEYTNSPTTSVIINE